MSISQCRSEFVAVQKTIMGWTGSYPQRPLYRVDGYEYLVTVGMHVNDPFAGLPSPLTLFCYHPDNSVVSIAMDAGSIRKGAGNYYEYTFPVIIRSDGWVGFSVSTEKERREKERSFYASWIGIVQKVFLRTVTDDGGR
ncbi:MAG: hypothetical protein HUU02_10215 [Bacteroidetes bacterium]|nr:hypothetical protein [Bacteroidota bacterium]